MRKEKCIPLIFVLLLVFNCLFPFVILAEATNIGTLYSIPSSTPTIDGYIDPIEWQDAQKKTFILSSYYDQTRTLPVMLYSIYDETDTLYIAVETIVHEFLTAEMMIYFQTNETHPIIDRVTNFEVTWNDGLDAKWLGSQNVSNDMFRMSNSILSDDDYLGTNDFDVNCTTNVNIGKIYWEMVMPLNSGDVNGYDLSLGVGESINMFLSYEDDYLYTQIRSTDLEWDFCVLHIGNPPTNILFNWFAFTLFSLSFVATIIVVIINQRKRK